jgi:hypothetical protein
MKIKINLKPTEEQKLKQLEKQNELLQGVKISFMHFDSDGKITPLQDLKNINWIEYDKEKKM